MPVGAVIGAGALTAGATVVASKSNSKAINKASDAQSQSNAESVALQRDIYGQNKQALSPFITRGNAAGDTMNALLGLGGTNDNAQRLPTQQPNALAQYQGYNPDSTAGVYGMSGGAMGAPGAFGMVERQEPAFGNGLYDSRSFGQFGVPSGLPQTVSWDGRMNPPGAMSLGGQQQGQTAQQAADNAFDIYKKSSGYQFRLGEGMNALNSGYAGAGTLQSGAAMKAALKYGQDYASGEFGNYLGYLGNQQGVGLSGASALAGVGQGYANNITSMNQNNANALGQIAVARANNNNALIGGLTGAVGNTIGTLGGMGKL